MSTLINFFLTSLRAVEIVHHLKIHLFHCGVFCRIIIYHHLKSSQSLHVKLCDVDAAWKCISKDSTHENKPMSYPMHITEHLFTEQSAAVWPGDSRLPGRSGRSRLHRNTSHIPAVHRPEPEAIKYFLVCSCQLLNNIISQQVSRVMDPEVGGFVRGKGNRGASS